MRIMVDDDALVGLATILVLQRLPSATIRLRYLRGSVPSNTLTDEWCLGLLPFWSVADVVATVRHEIIGAARDREVLVLCIDCVPMVHSMLPCHRACHMLGARNCRTTMEAIRRTLAVQFWEMEGRRCACGSCEPNETTIVLSLVESLRAAGPHFIFRHQVGDFVFLHFTK